MRDSEDLRTGEGCGVVVAALELRDKVCRAVAGDTEYCKLYVFAA